MYVLDIFLPTFRESILIFLILALILGVLSWRNKPLTHTILNYATV